jgi:hypothetical protein
MPTDKNYNQWLHEYLDKMDKELGLSKKGMGFVFIIRRSDEPGCADMGSNMDNLSVIGTLEEIIKQVKNDK